MNKPPDLSGLQADVILRKSRAGDESLDEIFRVHGPRLIELAERHGLSYSVTEDVVSGAESMRADKLFGQVMKKTEAGLCNVWIVMDVDRLARPDMEDTGRILKTIIRNGVYILTPDRLYDPANYDDLMLIKVKLFLADWELATYKKRMAASRDHIVRKECRYASGRAPFGYRYVPEKKAYEADPATYPVIEYAWSLVRQYGMNTIARKIEEEYGLAITANQIGNLMHNPFYAGYPCGRYSRNRKRSYSRLENDSWVWPEREGDYPHPVTLAEWREIQGIITKRHANRDRTTPNTWARDVLWFTVCGTGARGISTDCYVCKEIPKHRHVVEREKVHRVLEYALWYLFSDPKTAKQLLRMMELAAEKATTTRDDLVRRLRSTQDAISTKQGQVKRLMQAYSVDLSEAARRAFDDQIAEWSGEMELLAKEREALVEKLSLPAVSAETVETLRRGLHQFDSWWPALSIPQKREVCSLVFERVEISLSTPARECVSAIFLRDPLPPIPCPPASMQGKIGIQAARLTIELRRAGKWLDRPKWATTLNCSRPHSYVLYNLCLSWP